MTTYYKALSLDNSSTPQGYGVYDPLPGKVEPKVSGKLVACYNGYHILELENIRGWNCPILWEVKPIGKVLKSEDKSVCRCFKWVRKCERWEPARWGLDCAEHVLHIFEECCPGDKRPRQAIDVARKFLDGQASREALDATADAARAAADADARAAARVAAAARAAARAAADADAAYAAHAAADAAADARADAAYAAHAAADATADAAHAAAHAAARAAAAYAAHATADAAHAAADAAARAAAAYAAHAAAADAAAAEVEWQNKQLEMYLMEI